jgi:hypothetical protein
MCDSMRYVRVGHCTWPTRFAMKLIKLGARIQGFPPSSSYEAIRDEND